MRIRHHLEYAGLRALASVLRALPHPIALEIGAAIGTVGWWLRLRRDLVLSNLAQALPDLTPRERRRVAANAARNFGRVAAEFVRFTGRDRTRLAERLTVHGVDELKAALARGQGAVVVTAHLGSWALYVAAIANTGVPCSLLVGRQHNPKVDAFILAIPGAALRFISKGRGAPREVLRSLEANRAVVMVADQHAGAQGEMAPFLGRAASTLPLPGLLAARYRTPLLVMGGHRVTRGAHCVEIVPLAVPTEGDEVVLRGEITARSNDAMSALILAHPDQYFWYHRRWRDDDPIASAR